MKRLILLLAVALAAIAGTARADTFAVIPTGPVALPSTDVPNLPGQLVLRPDWTSAPAQPQTLSFPKLQGIWQRAGSSYGVPWQVLAAINKIESNFGRNMGPSSAGAIGWMQFIPSTWLRWGLDASGDGVADPWDPQDAVFAAARYLAASGGGTDIQRAIFSYNHAQWYVDEVMQLARLFGSGGGAPVFQLDRSQQDVAAAAHSVVQANRAVRAARQREQRLLAREQRIRARADRTQLLSSQLELERQAGQLAAKRWAVAGRARRLVAALDKAQEALTRAQSAVGSSSLSTAGAAFGAASYQDGYVFPVGGGPSVVSVAHTHHDYPAADIAAPEGSPAYALADAVVVRAWSAPDPRCGIGLTIHTSDGQTWTYCHLSYLEPTVQLGTALSAGTLVGLVGHTGDASGPHLHLQLDPTTRYPQSEAWFQQFAGTAFRWQDASTPAAPAPARSAPVFAVVPPPPPASERASGGVITFTR
jgi:murein DD-endopeptidase MepM/ murein hydrolase activator NlpD